MWYYSNNGEQTGPLDDTALDQLVAAGTVTSETLVWRDGLAEWTPLGRVRAVKTGPVPVESLDAATCQMCGKVVGADNLVELMGLRACAACKPMAVQSLREGARPAGSTVAWSAGKKVVCQSGTTLPARCYKCNNSIEGMPMKRKLHWHPPGFYLLIFVNIILYAIVAAIVRKRASIEVSLCAHHLQRRKYFILGGWIAVLLGMAMLIAGITKSSGLLGVGGVIVMLLALIAGVSGASIATASRIKGETVWLGGAGREFLASLPPMP